MPSKENEWVLHINTGPGLNSHLPMLTYVKFPLLHTTKNADV